MYTEQDFLNGLDLNIQRLNVATPRSPSDMDRFWADVERAIEDRKDSAEVIIIDSLGFIE